MALTATPHSLPSSSNAPTVVLESGLAGSPLIWTIVAKLLEPDFRVVIHHRAGCADRLPQLAERLRTALRQAGIPAPFLVVAHSFGALVARQFAVRYPGDTAGLVFVDGLPPTTLIPCRRLAGALLTVRFAELIAALRLTERLLPLAARHIQVVRWALAELQKLPGTLPCQITREWNRPRFYRSLAQTLSALPANLRIAEVLQIPAAIPVLALHSDYPDPQGRRIANSGHWIQIDQPHAVAAAIREIAEQACHNRTKGV